MQHFWARTGNSIWKNRTEKQSLTISNLQCAVWGSGPLVENVQEPANWKFQKTFRKKWLYTYKHACCGFVHSLYKEFCLFPGPTNQLPQSWAWQETSVAVLTLSWEVLALPCALDSIPSLLFTWLWENGHGKSSLHCSRSCWAFLYVHFDVLYSYQCSDWWINTPKGVSVHMESFDGSVWFQSWNWIVYRLGSGPHNLHLVGYGGRLLWNLRKIWEVSFLSNDKTQILSSFYWQNIVGNIGSSSQLSVHFKVLRIASHTFSSFLFFNGMLPLNTTNPLNCVDHIAKKSALLL